MEVLSRLKTERIGKAVYRSKALENADMFDCIELSTTRPDGAQAWVISAPQISNWNLV